jgi:hypothetical protein
VQRFYQLVTAHQFDQAAQLWDSRMRAEYPPADNINGRFADTQAISLASYNVQSNNGQTAVVAVDIRERLSSGATQRFVGTWTLVRGPNGWLLDQPNLEPG